TAARRSPSITGSHHIVEVLFDLVRQGPSWRWVGKLVTRARRVPQGEVLPHRITRGERDGVHVTREDQSERNVRMRDVNSASQRSRHLYEVLREDRVCVLLVVGLGTGAEGGAEARIQELLDEEGCLRPVAHGIATILENDPVEREVDRGRVQGLTIRELYPASKREGVRLQVARRGVAGREPRDDAGPTRPIEPDERFVDILHYVIVV